MTKIDLITGFLGAGKTTFIRHYLEWMRKKEEKVRIIENEFGSAGIDAMLLADEETEIDDLSGACMCCVGLERFKQMLVDAARSGCSRVLVEPSGIYDVDEFFTAVGDPRVREYCEIGSIITVVDGKLDPHLTEEARYLMFTQLLAAGTVVMSKVQLYDETVKEATLGELNELMAHYGSEKCLTPYVIAKDWKDLTEEDFEELQDGGFCVLDHERRYMDHQTVFQASILAGNVEDPEDLDRRLDALFLEDRYGVVLRIKGHIQDLQGQWYEMNCTKDVRHIRTCDRKRGMFVVIGQNLDEVGLGTTAFIPRKRVKG